MPAPVLFTPFALRGLELANRVVVSPMCQYSAEDGRAGDWHLAHLGQLAVSGPGLVILEATAVEPRGRITPRCLGLWDETCEAALARVVRFCREHGQARLGIQLAHAGRKASTHPPWLGQGAVPEGQGGWQTVAPSALAAGQGMPLPQALSGAQIEALIEAFAAAARRAARAGFDLVEIHAAHGYLLHEFLSPLSNHREDQWGGSLENRMRLPLAVFEAVRAEWPSERPLGVRVSATDWVAGGWDLEQTVALARALAERGCDFLDCSSGGLSEAQEIPLGPGYQVPFAERVRRETGMATIAVGLISEPRQAEAILAGGRADLVALARGMLDDPRWTWHAAAALGAEVAYPGPYLRCRPEVWPPARERAGRR